MPGGGNRAGVAGKNRRIEAADIHTQLQGIRRHHTQNLSLPQTPLDFAPLAGKVTSPVGANGIVLCGAACKIFLQVFGQNFRPQPRVGEDDGLQSSPQKDLRQPAGFVQVGAANSELRVDDRRIVEKEMLFARRRSVLIHQDNFAFEDLAGQLRGIGDGRRRADKLKSGAVEGGNASQPPEDVAQVAAEYATVGMELVDDHVAKILKKLRPFRMVRQYAGVKHVRVGDDQVSPRTNGFAGVLRGIAVVGEGANVGLQRIPQAVDFRQLILREGLGGE